MQITGKSNETYNFTGIPIDTEILKSEFFEKPALIVICNFDDRLPLGSVNYVLTKFGFVTEDNINVVIQDVKDFFYKNVAQNYSDKAPNYIGYYIDGDLNEIYNDITEGIEYKTTFKILR